METVERTARHMCALDLRLHVEESRIPALVDRFWPVLANEIRQGILDGEWPYSAKEIEALTAEYRDLMAGP